MASTELEIVRRVSSEFIVQTLPDGSAALFEVATKNVYSLNPSAAAAWEACASPAPVSQIAASMARRLGAPITEDLAHEAVAELVTAGLATVTASEGFGTSRRAMLKQVAGVALPVVLVLTGAQQKAHAQGSGSNPPPLTTPPPGSTTPPPGTTTAPGTTGPPVEFCIIKGLGTGADTVPLANVHFDIKNSGGTVVAQLVTDAEGKASTLLPPGNYTLVETDAPGGLDLYVPFAPTPFTLTPNQDLCLDRHNILKS